MFTKQNPKSQSLALQDVCANLMKRNDDLRASTKFLMKQFLMESTKQNAKSGQAMKLLDKLRKENLALKQSQNSQKMMYEQTIEKQRQQLHSLQKKLAEREEQVMQFRSYHESNMRSQSPQGPRRVSGAGLPQSSSRGPPQPPIQGFMIQREAQERAKQQKLETPQRRRPIMGSQSGGYNQHHHQSQQGRFPGDSSISPGGIRNITAATSFSFSGGQTKMRSSSSGGASPSQAFLSKPPGSYSRSQSPSSAFQNQSYARRQY
ncbi:unnamed protein product [Cylindrotheca closterium]|uniref:Uncharacterized protein n=1 Tax=Cylindrotheca closterium TaxID=2856 RepID=A0AAD2JLF7_9STRA|nr:unnamed protein product [Cylindrotheca closterium]